MKTRLITAGVGIVIALSIFIFSEMHSIVLTVAISIATTIMCGEYLTAKSLHKDLRIFIPCLVFAFLIPMLSYSVVGFLPYFLFVLYIAVISIFFYKTISVENILFTFFGITLITISMGLFTIRACAQNHHTSFWAVLILGVPWLADSGAYFVGSALGKHKLCPEISPKKTVEGAIGGIICATASPFIFVLIYMLLYGGMKVNWAILPVIGVVNALISIVGDLLFSVVKRGCNIKDYGSIMPGHGGLLDRFDSVILTVPVVYIISQYVDIIS